MARICDAGVRVVGPSLKEMARLAHTEYFIEGAHPRDPREILRETLFAPTVTGSPLENACRVIARYEPEGRGYYSGVVALIGRDARGARTLDSAILIRTADIDRGGPAADRRRRHAGAPLRPRLRGRRDPGQGSPVCCAALRDEHGTAAPRRASPRPRGPGAPQRHRRRLLAAPSRAPRRGRTRRWRVAASSSSTPRTPSPRCSPHQLRSLGLVVTVAPLRRAVQLRRARPGRSRARAGRPAGRGASQDRPPRGRGAHPAGRAAALPRGLPEPPGPQPGGSDSTLARREVPNQGRAAQDRPLRHTRGGGLLQHLRAPAATRTRSSHRALGPAQGQPRPGDRRGARAARAPVRLPPVPRRVGADAQRGAHRRGAADEGAP